MRIPLACTLSARDADERVVAWREAFAASVHAWSRPAPTRFELVLAGDPVGVAALVDLAQHEKACCAFFSFTFAIEPPAVRLVVSVPPDAAAILDDFAQLVPAR